MKRMCLLAVSVLGPICGFLAGCEDPVKQTIITGLQGGATTVAGALITAFFQSMLDSGTTTTTLSVWLDTATSLVALIL